MVPLDSGQATSKPIKDLMKRSEIRILIVEDDATQGKAIKEAFGRAGYEVRWAANPDDAMNLARQVDFDLAFVDCLLPKTNGIELVEKLKTVVGQDLKVILASGIYKDKSFAKEALQKTGALAFLNKPYDLDSLLSQVDDVFGDVLDADLPALLNTLTLRELGGQDRINALAEGTNLHGFDLPLIYSMIFGSKLSGELHVTATDGVVSKLVFHAGELIQVFLQDSTSYFGVLLVEMGFTSLEEVDEALALENQNPIGERLVAAHSLSPHAIEVVREEQMLIRLSKTVQDTFIEIKFHPSQTEATTVALSRDRLTGLAWDWICSKISIDWLKSFYGRWLEHSVVLPDAPLILRKTSGVAGLAPQVSPVLKALATGRPVGEILESGDMTEDSLLPVMHFLLTEKHVYFGSRGASIEDAERRIARLKKMLAESANRDHFQILGVTPKALEREISRNYMELAKNFHPDRVEPSAPPELRHLTEQYFARITQAHDILKDTQKRQAYAREVLEGSAEKILQNESLFEQGQAHLRKGKYQLALETFTKLASQRQHRSDLFIYLCWAKMKVGSPDKKIEVFLNSINEMISKVPPEDRHSATYFYVKGLFNMQVGDLEKAKSNLKHALILDSNFMEARRDLAVARNRMKNETGGDLSTMVHNLFGGGRKRR